MVLLIIIVVLSVLNILLGLLVLLALLKLLQLLTNMQTSSIPKSFESVLKSIVPENNNENGFEDVWKNGLM